MVLRSRSSLSGEARGGSGGQGSERIGSKHVGRVARREQGSGSLLKVVVGETVSYSDSDKVHSRRMLRGRVGYSIAPSPKHAECEDTGLVGRLADGSIVLGVFDGLGGYENGREASQSAVRIVLDRLDYGSDINKAFLEAHAYIGNETLRRGKPSGTTGCAVHVHPNGQCEVISIGNSRLYRVSREGAVEQVTLDQVSFAIPKDTARALCVRLREIGGDLNGLDTTRLSEYAAGRHILNSAIGTVNPDMGPEKTFNPELASLSLNRGDRLVLVTDGIGDVITHKDIRDAVGIAQGTETPLKAAKALMRIAESRSEREFYVNVHGEEVFGSKDDRLVMVFQF